VRRFDVRYWHKADIDTALRNVRFWVNSGIKSISGKVMVTNKFEAVKCQACGRITR
jgi:hypothetical protein